MTHIIFDKGYITLRWITLVMLCYIIFFPAVPSPLSSQCSNGTTQSSGAPDWVMEFESKRDQMEKTTKLMVINGNLLLFGLLACFLLAFSYIIGLVKTDMYRHIMHVTFWLMLIKFLQALF